MDDFLKMAMEMVKAQAGVRVLSPDEIVAMVDTLAAKLKGLSSGESAPEAEGGAAAQPTREDVKRSIKEKSVTCLECGKVFKILSAKHLAQHGLTPKEYRKKHGMKPGASLTSKSLSRSRKKKMQEMELWKKRGPKKAAAPAQTQTAKKAPASSKKAQPPQSK